MKVISNVKFISCVDLFHEVKSKCEKKKEVHVFWNSHHYILFESSCLIYLYTCQAIMWWRYDNFWSCWIILVPSNIILFKWVSCILYGRVWSFCFSLLYSFQVTFESWFFFLSSSYFILWYFSLVSVVDHCYKIRTPLKNIVCSGSPLGSRICTLLVAMVFEKITHRKDSFYISDCTIVFFYIF